MTRHAPPSNSDERFVAESEEGGLVQYIYGGRIPDQGKSFFDSYRNLLGRAGIDQTWLNHHVEVISFQPKALSPLRIIARTELPEHAWDSLMHDRYAIAFIGRGHRRTRSIENLVVPKAKWPVSIDPTIISASLAYTPYRWAELGGLPASRVQEPIASWLVENITGSYDINLTGTALNFENCEDAAIFKMRWG